MLEKMVTHLLQRLARGKTVTIIASLALTLGLGIVDYATGREIVMSPFYLLPICWASWVAGRRAGLVLSFACAVSWLVADVGDGVAYQYRAVPYWNALMLLVFFAVVVILLTAFHDAHRYLERTVAERTASLQEEIAERKRAEAAKIRSERLAVVGTMAAEVAHEIRNPLGSIALNLDLIQKELGKMADTSRHPPKEGNELANEVRTEIRRIRDVLDDYLQFARLSKAQLRPLALHDLLTPKLVFMKDEFERAGVKLQTNFDPKLTNIHADPEQLWQAILNLLRNSLEAMPDGGELTVTTRQADRQAVVEVSDNGKGMTDEQLKRIFEPFYTTKQGGTGLGLALVQQIINEHGGRVVCESALGKGCVFTLFLPLSENS